MSETSFEQVVKTGIAKICWFPHEHDDGIKKNKEAVALFEQAALNEDDDAHYWLGTIYFNSLLGEEQFVKAFDHFKKAYELNHKEGLQPLRTLVLRLKQSIAKSEEAGAEISMVHFEALEEAVSSYVAQCEATDPNHDRTPDGRLVGRVQLLTDKPVLP